MKIIGKSGKEYEVEWQVYGYAYARAYIVVPARFWFTKKIVLKNPPNWGVVLYVDAERYSPGEIKEWFQSCIDFYEEYNLAWSENE